MDHKKGIPMIKKTRSIISISFFLLLLTCSGMEKIKDTSEKQSTNLVEKDDQKETILKILHTIDLHNKHILSNGYQLNDIEKQELGYYAYLNNQRKIELASEEEPCTRSTIPALIVINKQIREKLIKLLSPKKNEYTKEHYKSLKKRVKAHQTLLEKLESLKKYSPTSKQNFPYY
jgi:hypothetical protein